MDDDSVFVVGLDETDFDEPSCLVCSDGNDDFVVLVVEDDGVVQCVAHVVVLDAVASG